MRYHLCVEIDGEISRIVKTGKTVLSCSPSHALSVLSKARHEDGKQYRSGCDNMTKDGHCGGHKDIEQ